MNLRDELIEAFEDTTPITALRAQFADSVISVLLRRASEAGAEGIAERLADDIDSKVRTYIHDEWKGPSITEIIQSTIAEAIAASELSPRREAERETLEAIVRVGTDILLLPKTIIPDWGKAFDRVYRLAWDYLDASQSKPLAQGTEGEKE